MYMRIFFMLFIWIYVSSCAAHLQASHDHAARKVKLRWKWEKRADYKYRMYKIEYLFLL